MTAAERLAIASVMLCAAARDYIEADGSPHEEQQREALEVAALHYAIEWEKNLAAEVRGGRS